MYFAPTRTRPGNTSPSLSLFNACAPCIAVVPRPTFFPLPLPLPLSVYACTRPLAIIQGVKLHADLPLKEVNFER